MPDAPMCMRMVFAVRCSSAHSHTKDHSHIFAERTDMGGRRYMQRDVKDVSNETRSHWHNEQ